MGEVIRVVVIHESRVLRESLACLLDRGGVLSVIGTVATDGEVAVAPAHGHPDVVLLHVGLCCRDLVRTIREVGRVWPNARVVVVGVDDSQDAVLEFVQAGAVGCVSRDASLDEVVDALRAAHRGEVACSPRIAAFLFRQLAQLAAERRPARGQDAIDLTPREREVLELMGQGLINKEIARRLQVEAPTAKNHVHNILEKLRVHRRQDAVQLALQRGLLPAAENESSHLPRCR